MGTPLEICMPHFSNDSCPLLSCLFGSLPEAITEILEQKFQNHLRVESVDISASNYVEYIRRPNLSSCPNYLFTDQVRSRRAYLMGINSLGFSRFGNSNSATFTFLMPNKSIDIIDYWNLRATWSNRIYHTKAICTRRKCKDVLS